MALQPQIRFAITARVEVILPEERLQRAARFEVSDCFRRKSKRPVFFEQREVEDEVFAVVQPFWIAVHSLPRGFRKRHTAAGWQKLLRLLRAAWREIYR